MGDRDRVQLLLWRAGMGATPAQVDAATAKGYAAAVEDMLNYPDAPANAPDLPPWPAERKGKLTGDAKTRTGERDQSGEPAGHQDGRLAWWANLMRTSSAPLQENLTLFWHNHFATANDKVRRPAFMLKQNQLFRAQGAGKFVDLLIAVSKDPAMLHLARWPRERHGAPERELVARGDGTLHPRHRQLHRAGCPRGGTGEHRLDALRTTAR